MELLELMFEHPFATVFFVKQIFEFSGSVKKMFSKKDDESDK
ncbi:hypothetical protein [Macrococcoides canis]|nr:hypothetical protein [Macrococcus canis]